MLDSNKVKLGCAPINWTNDDLPSLGGELTFQQCVSEMALGGYKGSEIGTKYPKDKDVLKKALDLRGLQICNGWFSSFLTSEKPIDYTLDLFKTHADFTYFLGARVVGIGECGVTIHGNESIPLSKAPVLSDQQFEKLAKGLNEIGKIANEKGMKAAFHYHIGTGVQSMEETERILSMTNPDLVGIVFDTGHSTLAGADPIKLLEKHMDRVKHIHLKDVRSSIYKKLKEQDWSFLKGVKEGLFTVPGDGDMVDWDGVFDILNKSDYEGWIVVEAEQDPALADPLEYAMKARRFIAEKTGL
ncbi:MAG: myo-inosose-2 dehydratase [Chloroflexi bacterium]|nr:myo-inosose-2 dehydratase [Chloroflexota bacterium]